MNICYNQNKFFKYKFVYYINNIFLPIYIRRFYLKAPFFLVTFINFNKQTFVTRPSFRFDIKRTRYFKYLIV